jgi:hypothetical protein
MKLGPCPGPTIEAAVVVTVTVAVEVFDPSSVTELGKTVHVAAVGALLQLRETAWLKPFKGVRLSV